MGLIEISVKSPNKERFCSETSISWSRLPPTGPSLSALPGVRTIFVLRTKNFLTKKIKNCFLSYTLCHQGMRVKHGAWSSEQHERAIICESLKLSYFQTIYKIIFLNMSSYVIVRMLKQCYSSIKTFLNLSYFLNYLNVKYMNVGDRQPVLFTLFVWIMSTMWSKETFYVF